MLTPSLLSTPLRLRQQRQWVVWHGEQREDGRLTKKPVNARTGDYASTTDPETWTDYVTAADAYRQGRVGTRRIDGIGYVFTAADGLVGIDIDHCVDPDTGVISPDAQAIVDRLNTYTEISQSGSGLHLICQATMPGAKQGRRKGRVEMYSAGRYFVVTGHALSGYPLEPQVRDAEIGALHEELFAAPEPERATGQRADSRLTDGEVIERASRAGHGSAFCRLFFGGDTSAYDGDESRADLALCSLLAFWTGNDQAQIERLWLRSELGRRHKVRNRADYRATTIAKAFGTEVYQPGFDGAQGQAAPTPADHPPVTQKVTPWPRLNHDALHGLAGDVVRALDPTTEADQVAVLATLLSMFGNAVGRGPHVMVGDDRHGANIFVALVGDTGAGRKGTSRSGPERLMALVDEAWATQRIQGGLGSGEGLVWAVRDPRYETSRKTGEQELVDAGVTDKRLTCIEEEFSAIFKIGQRQGATSSELIRRAWDGRGTLRIMTKNSAASATGAHISMIAHITKSELSRVLTETDAANGFANRYIWFCVKRSKFLPEPERMPDDQAKALRTRIREAYDFAIKVGELKRDDAAKARWREVYPTLSVGRPGLAGALTARAAPQVLRLSLIYALLDCSPVITATHLDAALALWHYADASVRHIFGDLTGDDVADRVLTVLRRTGPKTSTEISELFGRNVSSARLHQAFELLIAEGKITSTLEEKPDGSRGRRATIYTATGTKEATE